MSRLIDLTGRKFGKLTVIKRSGSTKNKQARWECLCECGNRKVVTGYDMTSGRIKSCGCESVKNRFTKTHGFTKERIYSIWAGIKNRCYNDKKGEYFLYGGRGIFMCESWRNDFMSFYEWSMENGYKDNLTIDRIDNNKGYFPDNCRWVAVSEQNNNKRNIKRYLINGEMLTIPEISKKYGINKDTLYSRVRKYKKGDSRIFKEIIGKQETD